MRWCPTEAVLWPDGTTTSAELVPPVPRPVPSVAKTRRVLNGKHTKNYGKWPLIVDFPIENGDLMVIPLDLSRI